MKPAERMTVAAVCAVLLAGLSLVPVIQGTDYLTLAAALLLSSALAGAAARRWGAGESLVLVAQAAGGLGTALIIGAWSGQLTPHVLDTVPGLLADAVEHVRVSYAPMPPHPGVTLITAGLLWTLYLVVEILATGLDRPGWTFPPLLVPYLVPAFGLATETPFAFFALCATGYLGVLTADGVNRYADPRTGRIPRRVPATVAAAGAGVAVVALLVAYGAGSLVPERIPSRLGPVAGSGPIQMGDPSLDLVRNLNSASDQVVITYRTTRAAGVQLRLAALSEFDDSGFHLAATPLLELPPSHPPGLSVEPTARHVTEIQVGNFGSEWLPLPWAPIRAEVEGDWRHDPATLAVIALGANRKLATLNLAYRAESQESVPGPAELASATAGRPSDEGITLAIPNGMSQQVATLAGDVTQGAGSDGARALALLDFFHSRAFRYSTTVVPGSAMGTLTDFLLNSRSGYCEQFAGGMAAMARTLGIPSRVAIGFLPGRQVGDHWEVSLRGMHAWTELYFDRFGWVPFDPTPAAALGTVPSASASASPSSTPEPEATPSTASAEPEEEAPQGDVPVDAAGGPGAWWMPAMLVVLAGAPWVLRGWRRFRRLSPHASPAERVEFAWDEVRDSIWDAGGEWPEGSPRQVGEALAARLPESAPLVRELAVLVEQARYADRPADVGSLRPLVTELRSAIGVARRPGRRWWRLWPRSVWLSMVHRHRR